MEKNQVSFSLGRYECLEIIGKGGMGEVLLAYDPFCDRQVAIKRIRPDLQKHSALVDRFLREAKITARLTHPGIISIYTIHHENEELYYTMPFIEGETLRQILVNILQKRGKNLSVDSIPSLLPIFRSVCMTISYAHSKGIIHRDIKPENILVGTFGEVIVFDWGLAQILGEHTEPHLNDEIDSPSSPELTSPGKLVGTVAFMAPERALGMPASLQTDIYSLGVILYQLLTLHLPFKRASIKEFRKTYKHEKLLDPEEVAPYRDVPPRLSRIVRKCLDPDPQNRYQTMEELIHDLNGHMEGRSEWFESAKLHITKKSDWEFQENVLISKHIAITRSTESAEWVSIMVSRPTFAENTRLHTQIYLGESSAGIGFLLSVPEAAERDNPLEGYCLWLGSELRPGLQLFRNTVQVMHHPQISLKCKTWHSVMIEKIDHNIYFHLDGILRLSYLSYLPLFGTHVGLLSRDADFEIDAIDVSVGSQNLQVSCLSIPDAFLASKDYRRALAEYRRIGCAFPGHAEGREALFRAGITLLEQAKGAREAKAAEDFYTLALEEFAKLHNTPGAPLEYLGKALVYESQREYSEEIKCLELGLRRYSRHPLVSAIKEQILYRMHEAAQTNRRSAYQLILISLRLLPEVSNSGEFRRLFKDLITNWEPLPFIESPIDPSQLGKEKINEIRFATPVAFWLGAPYILQELFQELLKLKPLDLTALGDIIYALFELGSYELSHRLMQESSRQKTFLPLEEAAELKELLELFDSLYLCRTESVETGLDLFFSKSRADLGIREWRILSCLLKDAILNDKEKVVEKAAIKILDLPLSREDRISLDSHRIWALLKAADYKQAGEIFETYPLELLNQEGTSLHPLFGCYLLATEGEEIATIHFSGVIDTPFPRSWALLGHELTNHITDSPSWFSSSFLWERRELYQQLTLYYHIAENQDLAAYYRYLEREEYIYVP